MLQQQQQQQQPPQRSATHADDSSSAEPSPSHGPLQYHAYDDPHRPPHSQRALVSSSANRQHQGHPPRSSRTTTRTSATRVWSCHDRPSALVLDASANEAIVPPPTTATVARDTTEDRHRRRRRQLPWQSPPLRTMESATAAAASHTVTPLASPRISGTTQSQSQPSQSHAFHSNTHTNDNTHDTHNNHNTHDTTGPAALSFARQSAQAGFLHKRGRTVVAMKQRFFCLQAATHLYYFTSATDTEPTGCLDLQGSRIVDGDPSRPDTHSGTATNNATPTDPTHDTRFSIVWDNCPNRPPVVLEARTPADKATWMTALVRERLPYLRDQLAGAHRKHQAYACRVQELEGQVAALRLVEEDRDGAVQDAAEWRTQFMGLEEAVRVLTRQLGRSAERATGRRTTTHGEETPQGLSHPNDTETTSPDKALEEIDLANVPGTHFAGLYNASQQLRENWKLAVQEAITAVDDVTAANARVQAVEQRMAKAETHLCKIWEENCSLRKTLKQKKREKRVLVREVKNLRESTSKTLAAQKEQAIRGNRSAAEDTHVELDEDDMDADVKLIEELEAHVTSSLKLHESFLVNNSRIQAELGGPSSPTLSVDDDKDDDDSLRDLIDSTIQLASAEKDTERRIHPNVPLFDSNHQRPPVASLFDMDESYDDDDASTPSERTTLSARAYESPLPNPLLQLDASDGEEETPPQLCATSSQSDSSKSAPVRHLAATSNLSCPLADVAGGSDPVCMPDAQVYHLSFHSKRIGLQFQKVPPPPVKAKGLLTEAMTDDIGTAFHDYGDTTAAELRRISVISNRAKTQGDDENRRTTCDLATPVDAVLVCGFDGFDDSNHHTVRPKLGARLVAFDGVSVEIGEWTFGSVRKAIQARQRPLTLSFRNDYLTTEQRTILTKAVNDVEAAVSPPLNLSATDISALSRGTGRQTDGTRRTPTLPTTTTAIDDDLSVSVAGSDFNNHYHFSSFPQSFSGTKSVRSDLRSLSSGTFRTLSEAGSTTSVLSSVAPLVSNLLGGRHREPFTPEYLRRAPTCVEETPQHQDFKAELL